MGDGDIESLMAGYLPGSDQTSLVSSAVSHSVVDSQPPPPSLDNAFPKSSADVLHVKESLLPNKLGEDSGAVSGLDDSDNETNPATNEPPDEFLQMLNMSPKF